MENQINSLCTADPLPVEVVPDVVDLCDWEILTGTSRETAVLCRRPGVGWIGGWWLDRSGWRREADTVDSSFSAGCRYPLVSLISIANDTGFGWVGERMSRFEIVPGRIVLAAICPHPLVVASVHEAAKSQPRLRPQRVCEPGKEVFEVSSFSEIMKRYLGLFQD